MENVYDVVRKIVGIEVPIEIEPDLYTWGMFRYNQETRVCLIQLKYNNFHTLNVYAATHEAYHALRFYQRVEYYLCKEHDSVEYYLYQQTEERIVNGLALDFCLTNFPENAESFKAIYKAVEVDKDDIDKMNREKFSKGYCVPIFRKMKEKICV